MSAGRIDHTTPITRHEASASLAKQAHALATALERLAVRKARVTWSIDRKSSRSADDLSRRARLIARSFDVLDPSDQRGCFELALQLSGVQAEAEAIARAETH
jgi:hypothetical protein